MIDSVVDFVQGAMASPWIYLLIAALALADGFFPVVPGETLAVAAGVFAASGSPNLVLAIVAATVGAFAGDHVSYAIGRSAGARILRRVPAGTRRRAAVDWATRALAERGGMILVIARYVPGGRTVTTMTAGAVRYPSGRFALAVGLAAATWSAYSVLLGYLGGATFHSDPLAGLLLGLGLAVGTALAVEIGRLLLHHRRNRAVQTGPAVRTEPTVQSEPAVQTGPIAHAEPAVQTGPITHAEPAVQTVPTVHIGPTGQVAPAEAADLPADPAAHLTQVSVASETPKSPDGSVHQDSRRSPAPASSAST